MFNSKLLNDQRVPLNHPFWLDFPLYPIHFRVRQPSYPWFVAKQPLMGRQPYHMLGDISHDIPLYTIKYDNINYIPTVSPNFILNHLLWLDTMDICECIPFYPNLWWVNPSKKPIKNPVNIPPDVGTRPAHEKTATTIRPPSRLIEKWSRLMYLSPRLERLWNTCI